MHVLLRGGLLQRVRLVSGLLLFTFAATHFINHSLGLVSLELMHQVQEVRTAITRSTAGTMLLGAALATHITLGLYKLAMRRTLKLPTWEVVQILFALSIPFLLFPHIVNTRIARTFFGVNDTYLYELARLWPDRAVLQSLLLLLVWSHGCVGLHYWLRLSDGYRSIRPVLWIAAGLVPVLALAGFATSGKLTADIMSDPISLAQLKSTSNWPNATAGDTMARMRDLTQYFFGGVIALVAALYLVRRRVLRARQSLAITYRDGPTVRASPGMTLLETSRAFGIPHASVCGGRARCLTCRVKVEVGVAELPSPNQAEAVVLNVLEAPQNVRLACQLRPTAPMTVTILNRPAVTGPVQTEFFEIKTVVTAHARAVLANETADILTNDTVELSRWFADKVSYPIAVPPLGGSHFSILGGRVDYFNSGAIATLSLDRDGHAVSLFVMPPGDAEAVRGQRNGYSVVGWEEAQLAYIAVSDLDRTMLDELQDIVVASKETDNLTSNPVDALHDLQLQSTASQQLSAEEALVTNPLDWNAR